MLTRARTPVVKGDQKGVDMCGWCHPRTSNTMDTEWLGTHSFCSVSNNNHAGLDHCIAPPGWTSRNLFPPPAVLVLRNICGCGRHFLYNCCFCSSWFLHCPTCSFHLSQIMSNPWMSYDVWQNSSASAYIDAHSHIVVCQNRSKGVSVAYPLLDFPLWFSFPCDYCRHLPSGRDQ